MTLRLNIAKKIFAGYLLIVLAACIATFFLLSGLHRNRQINEKITNVYVPSVAYLNELRTLVINSKMLIKNWVFISSKPNTPEKIRLQQIQDEDFNQLTERLKVLVPGWPVTDQETFQNIVFTIRDTLFQEQKYVMNLLNNFESYNRPLVLFEATSMVEEDNDEIMYLTHRVLSQLDQLIATQETRVLEQKSEMKSSYVRFRCMVIGLGIFLILISALAAWFVWRSVVRPIQMLTVAAKELAGENPDVQVLLNSDDELQVMADALNHLGDCMRKKQTQEAWLTKALEKSGKES